MDTKKMSEFLEYLKVGKGLSPKTLTAYNYYLKNYIEFGREVKKKQEIVEFIRFLQKKGYSTNTINYHIIIIKYYYKFFGEEDTAKEFGTIKTPKKLTVIPTVDDIKELFSCKMRLCERVIFELLLSTGMRISELKSIKVKDIQFRESKIKIVGKGNKERIVFISERAMVVLNDYIRDEDLGPDSNLITLSIRHIQKLIPEKAAWCGVKCRVTPHTLRHIFATDLVRSGASLNVVKNMMGHNSILTTERYLHVDEGELEENFKKFHGKNLAL